MSTNSGPSNNGQHDVRHLVERAEKFSLRVPVVGTVRVPPPDQLAFYGALGLLAAFSVIDWPVALAVGVGQAVVARHFSDDEQEEVGKPKARSRPHSTTSAAAAKKAAKAAHS